ncbi:MAG: response regulator, partial [Gemmatimonadaceae bacterium]
MRILLVEDDRSLADIVRSGLEERQIRVVVAHDYHEGQRQVSAAEFDVIVLDVMLPGGNGFELCSQLRSRGVATPILMLTARNSIDDRVAGLDSGADDYLAKPFSFRELIARLRALARRRSAPIPRVISVADLDVGI